MAHVTRRGLLIGAGAAGALVVGFALVPRRFAPALVAGPGEQVFDSFLRLARDGTVSVAVPLCEMGQGIASLCAQIVAMELGADWRHMRIEPAPPAPVYADAVLAARWAPLWAPGWLPGQDAPDGTAARYLADSAPLVATADGTALAAFERPLREAAAAARAILAQAAAARWGVDWTGLTVAGHVVTDGRRRIGFARLVADAARLTPPDPPPLRPRPPADPALPQASGPGAFPRLDLPPKVDGSFVFAGDVRLPGMVHAAIAHAPQGDAVLASYDRQRAAGVRALVGVVRARRWLAAVATHWYAADKALTLMEPRFRASGRVVDSGALESALDNGLRKGAATRVAAAGDPDGLLARPALSARYDVAAALHAPLEPASATARLENGRLELWLATQAPAAAARAAARAAGVPVRAVTVYPMHAGGSFDARLDTRIAAEVATLARAINRPVQLTWSRWQETLAGFPRAPVSARMSAAISHDGQRLLGWRARLAMPATACEAGARLLDGAGARYALAAARGKADQLATLPALPVYAIPERAADHVPVALALPTGRYRGNAHGYATFFTECFIDECAHHAGAEPLAFRMGLLSGQPRLAACLQDAARAAMWGGGADASGQGIACCRMDLAAPEGLRSGFIAVVATARAEAGAVRVDRLTAHVDIGRIINRDIARQQIEGGLIFGLAMAVGGTTTWSRGLPQAGRLADLGLPLLADCPKVEVAFAVSDAEPFDPGELGAAVAAPAIANALFSATGARLRRLPLLSEGL